jgi:membrane protease YdiL (CAAX protease family)
MSQGQKWGIVGFVSADSTMFEAWESVTTSQRWLLVGVAVSIVGAWSWLIARWRRGEPILPPEQPRPVPWGLREVVLAALIWHLAQLLVFGGYLRTMAGDNLDDPDALAGALSARERLGLVGLANALAIGGVLLALRRLSGAVPSDLGLPGPGLARLDLVRGYAACWIVTPLVYAVMILAVRIWSYNRHPMEAMLRQDPTALMAFLAVLSGVVVSPIAEELLFRGVLQGWLTRFLSGREGEEVVKRSEVVPSAGFQANLATSLIFASLHSDQWPAPLALFVLSLAAGWLAQRTGGLIASISLHMTFNGFSTLWLLFA